MIRPALLVALGTSLVLAACSTGGAERRAQEDTARGWKTARPSTGTPDADYAFARKDVPYQQILTEARTTRRMALLFFWTSW